MKKVCIFLMALFFTGALVSVSCGDEAVDAAKAKFDIVRKSYIDAKKKLSGAEIKSLTTIGRTEKDDAVKNIRDAREEIKSAKAAYKAALSELHNAEMARDAKIDRSPWR